MAGLPFIVQGSDVNGEGALQGHGTAVPLHIGEEPVLAGRRMTQMETSGTSSMADLIFSSGYS